MKRAAEVDVSNIQWIPNAPVYWILIYSLLLLHRGVRWGDVIGGIGTLAMLKDSRTLRTLSLTLDFNEIGDAGAQALAMLKDSTTLRVLTLNLNCNWIGDGGAQALARLKDSTTLRTLTLNLYCNEIGDAGAQALAMLEDVGNSNSVRTVVGGL